MGTKRNITMLFEAFKAFRECMYEFKNRMIPFLQEIDKVKGPIGVFQL